MGRLAAICMGVLILLAGCGSAIHPAGKARKTNAKPPSVTSDATGSPSTPPAQKPIGPHIWYDPSTPCPTSWSSAECQEFQQAPPLGADDAYYQTTDYYEGTTIQIVAAKSLVAKDFLAPKAQVGQGFFYITTIPSGTSLAVVLPVDAGVPTLTNVVETPPDPRADFTTSTGASGYLDLSTDAIVWNN